MKYSPLGVSYETKSLLSEPLTEDSLTPKIIKIGDTSTPKGASTIRGSLLRNTDAAIKWGYIVSEGDAHAGDYKDILKPLTGYYDMNRNSFPLEFYGEAYEWNKWINEKYNRLHVSVKPNYLLIVGDAEQIPFGFQSLLASRVNVGRVCFDTLEELGAYVTKVMEFYENPPALKKEATIFATNWGEQSGDHDPTYYSYNQLVKPLSKSLSDTGVNPDILSEKNATKENLVQKLSNSKSALVFVASHGMGDIKGEEKQKEMTGAICTQNWNETHADEDLFTAKDIPDEDTPFLEGSVFFQFSCYGYGTPKYNDIVNFSNSQSNKQIAEKALVAAIPKKLLAHPKGPVAFIGHANETYLECFYEDNAAIPPEKRANIAEYDSMLYNIFAKNTMGIAMFEMSRRCGQESSNFTNLVGGYDPKNPDSKLNREINGSYLVYHDMKNFLLFGDPALKLMSMGA